MYHILCTMYVYVAGKVAISGKTSSALVKAMLTLFIPSGKFDCNFSIK